MTETVHADVVIVGGGTAGVSSAYHIAQRGKRVVLLERGYTASQASGVNFGGVRTNGRTEGEMPLSLRAKRFWHKLNDYIGDWCDFRISGHLEITHDEKEMQVMEKWSRMAEGHGQVSELLTPRQLRERYPWMSRGIIGGCLVPDDGSANPRLMVPTMALAARRMGADIREHTEVISCEHDGIEFTVATKTGLSVRAPRMVNACGAWSNRIASQFGEEFPIEPITPQMLVSEPVAVKIDPVIDLCLAGRYLYFRQVERGNILFGRGSGKVDLDACRAYVFPVNGFNGSCVATNLIPDLRGLNIIRTWSGIDGAMPDSEPILGFSQTVPNLVHAFGFSGHGFQLGPATGAVVAELVLDGRTATPIEAFRVGRFATAEQPDRKLA
jgi:sarcosine oxidase, subunit beta